MFRNSNVTTRRKLPKLTAAEQRALRRPKTDADLIEDAKEAYMFLTDMLIGAMIEPGRDPESWCRRVMRDALAAGTVIRISTRQVLWNAQRQESAFEWCRRQWQTFDLCKDDGAARQGCKVSIIDFDEPVRGDL
ncbi:TPA: hypothetical protein OMU21_004976 [Klebsiella aerogenes]|nr:hypothetical protein [Klebsiella aerogenes]